MIRLEKLLTWSSCITYDEGHVINEYIATICFHNEVEDESQQRIAYNRMKWWIYDVMQGCVLIHEEDPLLEEYRSTRQRVLALPNDPVDHLVAMMLYLKLNAIMEQKLIIDEIRLSSEQGDHVCYLHSNDVDEIVFDTQGWWIDSGPVWQNRSDLGRDDNVVALDRPTSWDDIGLAWDQPQHQSQVVYADFGKNAKK
jgi:hypothetical protein